MSDIKTTSNSNIPTENKMGTMPVNKLLLSMSLPIMASMLVQALYNIVDSIYVSRISEDALTAVSLAFPIQSLIIALGVGTGVGVNALLSRSLGEKEFEKANSTAVNGIFLSVINFVIFLLIGLFAVKPFYTSQTSDLNIINYGVRYLEIVCCFSFGCFFQLIFERLLQSTGKTIYSMISQSVGAVINIILDPILIFGLLGFPKMDVSGAAVATVIGQISAGIVAIILNSKANPEIKVSFKGFRPSGKIIRQIYAVGVPSIIMQSIGSVMVYGFNQILIAFSSTATAVFGVYFKLQSFIFMPVFGLNNGMIPIVAYNYGAKHKERLTKTIRLCVLYAIGIMCVGVLIFQLFPKELLLLFDASEHMLGIGIPALRIISTHFVFAGFCIVLSAVFQAFGNGVYSMIISICRQLLVLLPAAYLLSLSGNINLVWLAFPIAEFSAVLLNIVFMKNIYNKILKPMEESA